MKLTDSLRIVAYIDILGFKQLVEKSESPKFILDFISEIKRTYARAEKKKSFNNMNNRNLEITYFSDCMVISSIVSIENVRFIVELTRDIQVELLKKGVLIRGGISLGGCFHKHEKIFGMALNEAYLLESKAAVVPRIILSEELITYINNCHDIENKENEEEYSYRMQHLGYFDRDEIDKVSDKYEQFESNSETLYKHFVCKDLDGEFFIDYMKILLFDVIDIKDNNELFIDDTTLYNNQYTFNIDEENEAKEQLYNDLLIDIIRPLKSFINENLKNKNINVILKYMWLKNYYNNSINEFIPSMTESYKSKQLNNLIL